MCSHHNVLLGPFNKVVPRAAASCFVNGSAGLQYSCKPQQVSTHSTLLLVLLLLLLLLLLL
jgi:hypothetical protein